MPKRTFLVATFCVFFACVRASAGAEVPTSRTDPFLKVLRETLSPEVADFAEIKGKIDWASLQKVVEKAADAGERRRRQEYVDLWKAVAELHDFGRMCERPYVFEDGVLYLLGGSGLVPQMAATFRKRVTPLPFDPASYRRYLMTEEMPRWAGSVRYVAAGLLAGEGDREGMEVLLVGTFRAGDSQRARAGAMGARTGKALPLWEPLLKHENPKVRQWAVTNVAAIPGTNAEDMLAGSSLKDADYKIRKDAALGLMRRDRREAIPVLQEILKHELVPNSSSALELVPICCKLQEWNVPDLPWTTIEAQLRKIPGDDGHDYWRAIQLASWCVSAGREKLAMAFLKEAMDDPREWASLGAARLLLKNGKAVGIETVRRHISTAKGDGPEAYQSLCALGEFLSRGSFTVEEKAAVMEIARTADKRHTELFGNAYQVLVEGLGEMGALCRVTREKDALKLTSVVEIPYEGTEVADRWFGIVALYKARLRSLAASARQEKIELAAGFLEEFRKSEIEAITRLAHAGKSASAENAARALKEILPETDTEPPRP